MNLTQTLLKMIFDRWNASIKNCETLLNSLTDEQLQKEIAPNKNRGVYLLGHLIAVHDDMLILLDMGEKLYPDLHKTFIDAPDKAIEKIPSAKELRDYWSNQCEVLKQKFDKLQPESTLENARKIVGFRNRLIHTYDAVDPSMIWAILIKHLPLLKEEVLQKIK